MRIKHAGLMVALALGLFASSPSAGAQQPAQVARVGVLSDWSPSLTTKSVEPFVQGLRDLGYVEGQNITFERRSAAEKYETLPSLAAELVRLQPDVILAIGTGAARAAKAATSMIPVVFARTGDPVGSGLVLSLARPGGNLIGLSGQMVETGAKRLDLLITAVPDAKRVSILWDSDSPSGASEVKEIEQGARSLNIEIVPVDVRSSDDFDAAEEAIKARSANALIVVAGVIFAEHAQRLAELAAKVGLPTMGFSKLFAEAGGLMSYGNDLAEMYRRAAAYVDKILKGAKPADLPVEQPTRFELVINLNTAMALGLTIPRTLLGLADEVIE